MNTYETSDRSDSTVASKPQFGYFADYGRVTKFRINLREIVFAFGSRAKYTLRLGVSLERKTLCREITMGLQSIGYRRSGKLDRFDYQSRYAPICESGSLFTFEPQKSPNWRERFVSFPLAWVPESLATGLFLDMQSLYHFSHVHQDYGYIDKVLVEWLEALDRSQLRSSYDYEEFPTVETLFV